MSEKRVARLNSLLKEVIADVIRLDFKNPNVSPLLTVTSVEITKDLSYAKVFISIIGNDELKKKNLELLNRAAGYIAVRASKQVTMRFFPALNFIIDESVEKQSRIEEVLKKIEEEREHRNNGSNQEL